MLAGRKLRPMNTRSPIPLRPDYGAARARNPAPIVRSAMVPLLGEYQRKSENQILKTYWPNDENMALITRAATTMGTTATTTWASELAGRGVSDIISVLAPASAGATAMQRGLQFQFEGGYKSIGVAGITAVKTNASFVQEGKPIPVFKLDTSKGIELTARKLAAISIFTRETFEHSIPNIELLVRTVLAESVGLALDDKMLDATAGDEVRPAGLRYNINATAASAASTALEAMKADIGTLTTAVAPVAGSSPILLIASPAQAMAVKLWRTGGESAFEVLPSGALTAGTVIAIAANCLASAADPAPRFELAQHAVVHMDDLPADVVTGGTAATGSVKSLYQTDLLGLRTIFRCSWGLRSTTGLCWMQNVVW